VFVPIQLDNRIALFLFSYQGIENAPLKGHPLPKRFRIPLTTHHDFIHQLTRFGVQNFAGLVVSIIKPILIGDQCISMHHQSGLDFSSPEKASIVTIECCKCVQPWFLPFLESDMAKCLEDTTSGGHCNLWQGRIPGIGEELSEVRSLRHRVPGSGIIVRSMIGMCPIIHSFRKGFGPNRFTTDNDFSPGT